LSSVAEEPALAEEAEVTLAASTAVMQAGASPSKVWMICGVNALVI
jgi:hypothetical protein